jgi:uncharacterized protein YggE
MEETMKLAKIAVVVTMLATLAVAEERTPSHYVRVTGTSEVKVVPDRAVVEIGVEKRDPNASAAKHAEDASARRILAALRARHIDDKDIQTTYLSLQQQSSYVNKKRVYFFVASQTLSVTVRDISQLDTLLEAMVQAGGNQINSIVYETSELRKYRDQARDLAVKAAREKAQALARALGQDIGGAQVIEEVPELASFAGIQANASIEEERTRGAGPSLAPGQTSITASVTVSFELN